MSHRSHILSMILPSWTRRAMVLMGVAVLMASTAATAAARQENEVPSPEELELPTSDGVLLKATFYPGTEGRDSVPVMILHDDKGQRRQFHELALALQAKGHAVLVPDLRGYGGSTQAQTPRGDTVELVASRMPVSQYARIVQDDLETLKRFLMGKNNASELNINKLCVVGAGMGALLATQWAAQDWSWPPLATGKQGQDVKALALISPPQRFKNLRIDEALNHPAVRTEIAFFIAIGRDDNRQRQEAVRIYNRLKRYRTDPADGSLVAVGYETSLQAEKLLGKGFGLDDDLADFMQKQLVDQNYPWQDRPSPLP